MKVDFSRYKPDGYTYTQAEIAANQYAGQCKWYSAQISDIIRPLGNELATTLAIFLQQRSKGLAFYAYENYPVIEGYGAFFRAGATGHLATINNSSGDILGLSESNWIKPVTVDHDRKIRRTDSSLVGFFVAKPYPKYIVQEVVDDIVWQGQHDAFCAGEYIKRVFFTTEQDMTNVSLYFRRDTNVQNPINSDTSVLTATPSPVLRLDQTLYVCNIYVVPKIGLKAGVYREDFGLANNITHKWLDTKFNAWISYEIV